MLMINCKTEFKLQWPNHCVFAGAGIDDINANDSIIFTVKDTQLCVLTTESDINRTDVF